MNTNRGRKRRTEHERDSIREFNTLVREHSEDALQNILRLSKYADDENIRLKASTWIAEKLVGRNYSVANEERLIEHNNELTVHLVSVGNQHTLTQKEERIRKPEQVEHEKMIAPTLREMNAKMGKLFMKNFQLRQASKQLSN